MANKCKHYYKGESLYSYCKRNNINAYGIYWLIIDNLMTVEEAVAHFWERKGKKDSNNLKYSINGVSVKQLLNDSKLYQKFCSKLYKSKDKNVERIYNEIINAKETN